MVVTDDYHLGSRRPVAQKSNRSARSLSRCPIFKVLGGSRCRGARIRALLCFFQIPDTSSQIVSAESVSVCEVHVDQSCRSARTGRQFTCSTGVSPCVDAQAGIRSWYPALGNTRGTPPRDAAKIVRTTIHRVSMGV